MRYLQVGPGLVLTFADGWSLWCGEEGEPRLRAPRALPADDAGPETLLDAALERGWYMELAAWLIESRADDSPAQSAAVAALTIWFLGGHQ